MSPNLELRGFAAATDPGLVRISNEDTFVADGELGFFAVVDGMGGHASGKFASATVAAGLLDFIRQSAVDPDKTWPFEPDATLSDPANRLQVAVRNANRHLASARIAEDVPGKPGATMSAVLFSDARCVVSNVGDCRVYLIRDGNAVQLTTDHSLVSEQMRLGLLGSDAAREHPLRHVVTRAVSGDTDLQVDIWEVAIQPGDRLLLCSDGVHGLLNDTELARLAGIAGRDMKSICEDIVATANRLGGSDNATVVVVEA